MNREIKFRGLRIDGKGWVYGYYWRDNSNGKHKITVDLSDDNFTCHEVTPESVGQFTGLKDKHGKDIYEGQELKCRYKMTDDPDCFVDAIYKVDKMSFEGIRLVFIRLYNEKPNSTKNSFPINQSLSFYYRSLCTDSRNGNYDRLAINETSGENYISGRRWIENHYSNDIEIIIIKHSFIK